jgi:hypothetical protein
VSTQRGFLQYCSTSKKYCSAALPITAECSSSTNLLLLCSTRVQHVSQAPSGPAKCSDDPHARMRPKREAEGREPAAARHGNRGAILAGAAVSPPGPQRIIAQTLRACGIQTDRSQHYFEHYVVLAELQYEYRIRRGIFIKCAHGISSVYTGICVLAGCTSLERYRVLLLNIITY